MIKTIKMLQILTYRTCMVLLNALIDGFNALDEEEVTDQEREDYENVLKLRHDLQEMSESIEKRSDY